MKSACCIDTPVGPLTVETDERAVKSIRFGRYVETRFDPADASLPAVLRQTVAELERYFAGELTAFTVPTDPEGTPFQRRVWEALQRIPYGTTCSYGALAAAIGRPKACRAVGMANHRNPIPILIPCHRVVGADGSLTGYASGLGIKSYLLKMERPAFTPRPAECGPGCVRRR